MLARTREWIAWVVKMGCELDGLFSCVDVAVGCRLVEWCGEGVVACERVAGGGGVAGNTGAIGGGG